VVLTLFGFSSRRVRPFLGGVALGTVALLAQMVWSGDVAFVAGVFGGRVWGVLNVAICLWLARLALDGRAGGAKPE
jgi:hypothetical protein